MKILSTERYNELLKMEEKARHLEIQNLALSDEKYFNKLSSDTWKSIFKLNVKVLEEEIANKDAKIAELENKKSNCNDNYKKSSHNSSELNKTISQRMPYTSVWDIKHEFLNKNDAEKFLMEKSKLLLKWDWSIDLVNLEESINFGNDKTKSKTIIAHIVARMDLNC